MGHLSARIACLAGFVFNDQNRVAVRPHAPYSTWLTEADVPKLLIQAISGIIFSVPELRNFARSLPNQKIVQVYGRHFVQEISGGAIGRALLDWIPLLK